ncbi:MAG TPA: ATP-binding cassette domain-containing protein [Pirellulales bacterium]|jgi:ABC-type lipoprotein export system ATPase subunit
MSDRGKETAARPSLELDQLEIGLGPRRLQLDRRCVLQAGRLYLVVGPSGSGKSSFARALLGFGELSNPVTPCQGEIVLKDGAGVSHAIWKGTTYNPAARSHIAFLPQAEKLGFIDALTVTDNLTLFSRLDGAKAQGEIARLAAQFRLRPVPRQLANASGGERIRMSAVRGLLPRNTLGVMPELIIADEPTSALDHASALAMARSLIDLAHSGNCIVVVITHEPTAFVSAMRLSDPGDEETARIVECRIGDADPDKHIAVTVATLRMNEAPQGKSRSRDYVSRVEGALRQLGAFALAPVAFVWGLLGLHRPLVLLRQTLLDSIGVGTHVFSLLGCLLIAGTAAYFIFERLPKPELLDPLLLPEMMIMVGHTLVRAILPLGVCGLITTKLGAAQAARLAAATRGGLLETLALAGWRVEAYALVPAVLAQILAMAIGAVLALVCGVVLAGVVYVAGHEEASLSLTVNLMLDGLDRAPHWSNYLIGKIIVSGFLGGAIAALCGIVPSQAKDDLARAVHRTLLWSVLAVIACQCAFVIAEFRPE